MSEPRGDPEPRDDGTDEKFREIVAGIDTKQDTDASTVAEDTADTPAADPPPAPKTVAAEGERRPIVPHHWRRENIRDTLASRAGRHWHAVRYHGLRSPRYLVLAATWAVVGVFRVIGYQIHWWWVLEQHHLRTLAAASGDSREWHKLHKEGRETRKVRGIALAIEAAAIAGAVAAGVHYLTWLGWALFAVVALPVLARAGRPEDKPIVQPAVLPAEVQPPTGDVIVRALGALGIAAINAYIKEAHEWVFPSPVREDGPGWRAEIDLPYGVTATMVIDKREQLASGLRRPLGAVWPEPVHDEHTGRLELWVGRQDAAKAKQPPWPFLRTGQTDVFGPVPFGTDVRGRPVKVPLVYHNWLMGSIPRQGKTSSVRVLCCAAALDPLAELWLHELKGSGDLDPLARVSHRFVSGIHDEAIEYTAESLKLLRAEIENRTGRLRKLDRVLCPDKRTTREIAGKRSLKLWPLVCVIDEAQNLFTSDRWGKQAAADAEFIIKIGPAFGIILIIATQRPDKASVPTGVSGNVSMRFCLKVMGQVENDMVLGTSAYKNGIRATAFRPEIDAGIGYLVGLTAPQVVRAYYLNIDATERVAVRARRLREAAGTLSGVALDEAPAPVRDVLADVLTALGDDPGLHWQPLADRLAVRFPERWADATGDAVRAECAERGVPSVDVRYPPGRDGVKLKGCRRDLAESAAQR